VVAMRGKRFKDDDGEDWGRGVGSEEGMLVGTGGRIGMREFNLSRTGVVDEVAHEMEAVKERGVLDGDPSQNWYTWPGAS